MKWLVMIACMVGCCNEQIDLTECDIFALETIEHEGVYCLDNSNCWFRIEGDRAVCNRAGQRIIHSSGVTLVCGDDLTATCENSNP